MAIEQIDLGTVLQDGADGDTAREAFTKVNSNFSELDTRVSSNTTNLSDLTTSVSNLSTTVGENTTAIQGKEGTLTAGSGIIIDRSNPSTPVISATNESTGDVVGPTSSIDNEVVLFDGISGKTVKGGGGVLGTAAFQSSDSFEKELTAGTNITIDRTDPANPVINASGGGTWGTITGTLSNQTDLQAALNGKVSTSDSRLTDAREWTAATIDQAEAEAGVATTRRAWTSLRVRQAITSWWNSVSSVFGRTLVSAADASTARSTLGLGTAATRPALGTGALYGRDSILGTVSQTAGVPTGAVMEYGINANGEYWRYAGGMQVCIFRGAMGATPSKVFNLPASFAASSIIFAYAIATSSSSIDITFKRGANTDTTYTMFLTANGAFGAADVPVDILFVGRWY